jgi:hypothetical protein
LIENNAQQMRGADGVKTAVIRKSRASLGFIQAAAHACRYTPYERDKRSSYEILQRANKL